MGLEFDRFDRQLINLVQEDAGRTSEHLAERVPLSPSAIQRRLKRLREAGVIERQVALVDARKLGAPATFLVCVQVEQDRLAAPALQAWLAAEPQVQQAYAVTGESDLMLVVTAADTAAYDALVARLLRDNPSVRRVNTSVALGVLKRGLAIPVALHGAA